MLQVREGVFETNSSSTHSITICSKSDFERWMEGEIAFDEDSEKFVDLPSEITEEQKLEVENYYRTMYEKHNRPWCDWDSFSDDTKDECYYNHFYMHVRTYYEFMEDDYLETYVTHYITDNGDEIVAFGKYGHD